MASAGGSVWESSGDAIVQPFRALLQTCFSHASSTTRPHLNHASTTLPLRDIRSADDLPVNLRPRDAATLILLRGRSDVPRVLMGRRRTRDRWSDLFVFPGGRVDPTDHRVRTVSKLRPEVEARLTRSVSRARARALAVAAIRETFEETGLLLAKAPLSTSASRSPSFPPSRQTSWSEFERQGLEPALDSLHLLCRAITPPRRPSRFDARFFLADADHLDETPASNGELGDLQWVTVDSADALPLPRITQAILNELRGRLEADDSLRTPERTALYRTRFGQHGRELE